MDCVRGFAGQGKHPTLMHHSERLPEQGALFIRQSEKFIEIARLLPRNFRSGYG